MTCAEPLNDTGRLLSGAAPGLAAHRARYGPAPVLGGPGELVALVTAAGLRGRGGSGFPTARKIAAVAAASRRPVVVVNACESEPASAKDATLLRHAPRLVLDGALVAARALGADTVVLCVHRGTPLVGWLRAEVAARTGDGVAWQVAEVPRRYVASEASALTRFLTTGEARPAAKPPRPERRGVRRRPTLVDNAETLAHLALIARYGPGWYRSVGTAGDPGTTLVTVGGAVARPGVYEIALGTPVGAVLARAGGPTAELSATLVGGYAGTWVTDPGTPLTHDPAGRYGATVGAGVLVALPAAACGIAETARILGYLADESAGQCGPCAFGLPAVADDLARLAAGRPDPDLHDRLVRRVGVIAGRGACAHPTGAVRLAGSVRHAFAADVRAHLSGRPCRPHPPVLPLPAPHERDRTWQ
ncbi:NADH-ubiquinone oxidoreductase-F iron-sulfur binding region domain-containing protein [Actinocatenispora rupis]|uniref:NADH dehydrogenase n=1 Tax=Actinocatenispora rupis TaxID=519421 RepID=A0A8J3N976_9ACTN|nr:NADH-ubiquinone oxidoreductase-F iron-sulfur binding region domain-containing protein [Actinocatenispora rupis]GID11059.1 NADH dehydrogenase [Actinocatenispora rupis]